MFNYIIAKLSLFLFVQFGVNLSVIAPFKKPIFQTLFDKVLVDIVNYIAVKPSLNGELFMCRI